MPCIDKNISDISDEITVRMREFRIVDEKLVGIRTNKEG